MYKMDIDEQYDQTCNELIVALRTITNNFTLVCELTSSMNVHYHGVIELPTSKRKFVNIFRKDKKFGYVSCKEITNKKGWSDYISKDLENTQNEIGRRSILNDDYKMFSDEIRLKYMNRF